MEEEAQQILRAALQAPGAAQPDLGSRIRARFAGLGDVVLPQAVREPVRTPPLPDAQAANSAAHPARPARPRATGPRKPK